MFQYSESAVNLEKYHFQTRATQCTLSCPGTQRYVGPSWFSHGGLIQRPFQRQTSLLQHLSFPLFPKMQTCPPTFCFSFHTSSSLLMFFYLCSRPMVWSLSRDSSQGVNLFFLSLPIAHFLSTHGHFALLLMYNFLQNIAPSLCPCSPAPPPILPLLLYLPSHFLPFPIPHAHRGPKGGEWKVCVFCSSRVWQQEGKLLLYGFIYGSVDF